MALLGGFMGDPTENTIFVACVECFSCGQSNVVARVPSPKARLDSRAEHEVKCKKCGRCFKISEFDLRIRPLDRKAAESEPDLAVLPLIG
jgi:hypothetical protein